MSKTDNFQTFPASFSSLETSLEIWKPIKFPADVLLWECFLQRKIWECIILSYNLFSKRMEKKPKNNFWSFSSILLSRIWDSNISSSVQKMLKKLQKCLKIIFLVIFIHFQRLWNKREILKNHLTRETFKNHQVFYSCSAPGMLSIEKV